MTNAGKCCNFASQFFYMKLSEFKYYLPQELIALHPEHERDDARMMVLNRKTKTIEHKLFKDIVNYFDEGDLFVMNNTRVFPALLFGEKEQTRAKIRVFLLRELDEESRLWDVLVDPARKIRIGNKLSFCEDDSLVAEVIDNTPPADEPSASSLTGIMTPSRKS